MRSILMMPVNVPKFVDKAHTYGADAVMLDLEDAVASDKKREARLCVPDAVAKAGQGGRPVLVRVNNDPALLGDDIEAAVCPGLHGIVLPKAEEAAQVVFVSERLRACEDARGMREGTIKIALLVETAKGVLHLEALSQADARIHALLLGSEDFCRELGVQHSESGMELLYAMSKMVLCCKAGGLIPIGLMGSVANFAGLDKFRQAAAGAKQLGCEGGFCIHPKQIAVLHAVFGPSEEALAYARRVVSCYEQGLQMGLGSVSLDGKMIDLPVYTSAQALLQQV